MIPQLILTLALYVGVSVVESHEKKTEVNLGRGLSYLEKGDLACSIKDERVLSFSFQISFTCCRKDCLA